MKNISILKMTFSEAKEFFLKDKIYCNFDLPEYFSFQKILKNIDALIKDKSIADFCSEKKPKDLENVNYTILNNKDGKYAWRRMELIHPALYVELVNLITVEKNWNLILSKFQEFKRKNIYCLSIPLSSISAKGDQAEQISTWWLGVEQESIKLSTEFDHLIQLDLTDCYGSIYTHSISWALHGKKTAKENTHTHVLLGDKIDTLIRSMRNGQTNGIPQGSVLMDFVAELILGHIDTEIHKKIQGKDKYKIIRYRDDYRIFINDLSFGKNIVKIISECAADLGLKLNSSKTHISRNVITDSIKKDKLDWLGVSKNNLTEQKYLLLIHQHSLSHPNTGSINSALNDFYKILLTKEKIEDAETQISIVVDIAFHNPKTYPITSAIISKLISSIKNLKLKEKIINKIKNKFSKIPNTGHMEIWLQRVTYPFDSNFAYDEELCKAAAFDKANIWNNDWINSKKLKNILNPQNIIIKSKLESISPIVQVKEVDLFAKIHGFYP
jgi:RNA-directed DNA polymerase